MKRLVDLYGVEDEDQLPVPFDFLELLDTDKEDRQEFLSGKLADCPQGACDLVGVAGVAAMVGTP